jgi:putative membrane protein
LLASPPLRVLTDPVVAAALNVGGLWLLYTTAVFARMHEHPLLHLLVHVHVFATGWLFTVALVSVDPLPHRRSYPIRAAVLVAALAGHDILAKYLYAHPPAGVADAELGAMIMYYGGDAVHLVLIVLLCAGWYRLAGRRLPPSSWPPLSGAGRAAPRG